MIDSTFYILIGVLFLTLALFYWLALREIKRQDQSHWMNYNIQNRHKERD